MTRRLRLGGQTTRYEYRKLIFGASLASHECASILLARLPLTEIRDHSPSTGAKNRGLKQPRTRLQQERQKSAYLTMKNDNCARFARAFFIFGHLATFSFFPRREM